MPRSPLILPLVTLLLLNLAFFKLLPPARRGVDNPLVRVESARFDFDRDPLYDVSYPSAGWHGTETWKDGVTIVWSGGSHPELRFPAFRNSSDFVLEIGVKRALDPIYLDQLGASVNGHDVALKRARGDTWNVFRADVPLDWLYADRNNVVALETPPPRRPENSSDTRELGLAVDWIELAPRIGWLPERGAEKWSEPKLKAPWSELTFDIAHWPVGQGWSDPEADALFRSFRRLSPDGGSFKVEMTKAETRVRFGVLVGVHPSYPLFLPRTLFGPSHPVMALQVNGQSIRLTKAGDDFEAVFEGDIPKAALKEQPAELVLSAPGASEPVPVSWFQLQTLPAIMEF